MHEGKLIFSQLMEFVPWRRFHTCIRRYGGDYKVGTYRCVEQFRVMAFAQLTYRHSLREIEACLRVMKSKLYHMGILNMTPGQDTVCILSHSITQSRIAGMASVLGVSTGALFHTFAAACGLSALLAGSAFLFCAVKLVGAAYLVYLGARMLLSRSSALSIPSDNASSSVSTVYYRGLLSNVLNPKIALFFLAFVPQFIAADSPSKFLAFIALGVCFVAIGIIWYFCLAWFSSLFGDRLRHSRTFAGILHRTAGMVFIFFGVRLAVTK